MEGVVRVDLYRAQVGLLEVDEEAGDEDCCEAVWGNVMSATEYRGEGRASYGVVKTVISLPASTAPFWMNIYISVVDGCQM